MNANRIVALLGLVALLASSGCLFSREQLNVPQFGQRVQSIEPGKSTVAELEALVGPPTSITPIGKKRLLVYSFSDSKTATFNLVVFGSSKTNAGYDTAIFLASDRDVIEQVSITDNSKDLPWEFWAFGD